MEKKTYIDVIKGIAMLLVVMQHTGGHIDEGMRVLTMIDVPLFFICSGFLAYKPAIDIRRQAVKSIRRVLIPFLLATFFPAFYFGQPLQSVFLSQGKLGYWFFEALFLMFLLYWCLRRIRRWLMLTSLITEGLLLVGCKFLPETVDNIFGISYLARYFPCFMAGVIIRQFDLKMNINKWLLLVTGLVGVWCFVYPFQTTNISFLAHVLGYLSCSLLAFIFIKGHENQLPRKIQKMFAYIGRYSLNVYIIHFFFVYYLPFDCGFFVADFALILLIGLAVTAMSLATGKILTSLTPLDKILTP